MTDIPLHTSANRTEHRSLLSVLSRSVAGIADIGRLCVRSFSGMPSAMLAAQMLLYCDPYGLRDKKRPVENQDY